MKNWLKVENDKWINLDHVERIYVRSTTNHDGDWEIMAKINGFAVVIATTQLENEAYQLMDKIIDQLE